MQVPHPLNGGQKKEIGMKNICTCTTLFASFGVALAASLATAQSTSNVFSPRASGVQQKNQNARNPGARVQQPMPGGIAGGVCNTSTNDCCAPSPNGTPGCNDPTCCSQICAQDAFCCSVSWDGLCSGAATAQCEACGAGGACADAVCPPGATQEVEQCGEDLNGGCNAPGGASSCCAAHATPGCDDPDCQAAVCAQDAFCCDVQWDGLCSGAAAQLCGKLCTSGGPTTQPIACGDVICGTFWADANIRDTDWYEFTLSEARLVTWTVHSTAPHVALLLNSTCPAALVAPAGVPTGQCGVAATGILQPGTYRAFAGMSVFAGFPCGSGDTNNYVATLECADAPTQPNNLCKDRIVVTEGDTPFSTLGASTDGPPHAACEKGFADPQVNQDIWFNFTPTVSDLYLISLCAGTTYDSKMAIYDGCSCPILDDSTLLACDDDGCGTVGGASQFIVNLSAGSCYKIRVGGFLAATGNGVLHIGPVPIHPACGEASDHDCLTQGGPGCNQTECCAAVCLQDPFCCDVSWDGLCVNQAAAECGCGACPEGTKKNSCPTDLAPEGGDNQTNVDDLLILLQNWGPCD